MRSDYALYVVAIIFFILTTIVLAYQVEFKELWTITTAVLGLLFIGLGYSQRPKAQATAIEAPPLAPTLPTPPLTTTTEVVTEETKETVITAAPTIVNLTEVKGIGEKRAEQLKALGISSVEELARASAKDLATKLKISAKITEKWIENAKKLTEKP
jgi:predicted flap endonuclease-1-like 5' DNA nuclease